MGCCTSSHPGELEIVLRLDEQQQNSMPPKDSFLDVPLTSKHETLESGDEEQPEPVFFLHSTSLFLEAYTNTLKKNKAQTMHSRATSLGVEVTGASTVGSLGEILGK